ncbi:uncharacterized protein N7498_006481 [Penicillium cinerascens]|uniref:Uncharacterized protein n=1 Tax=Penicillium cinerascens TaxID=70096 RepID=A0A9W9MI82_9EURO|nr:uncharacterized protein N7498_006481 [Penicillium cinerascens]KAJ5201818.1 hypothetical protein N7498_006481 [Penicillium cinerascens]
MSPVPLIRYLQHEPPSLFMEDDLKATSMTKSENYKWQDIGPIGRWVDFNLTTIRQRYGATLSFTQIPDEPMPSTPLRDIVSEAELRDYFSRLIYNRVERSLRYGFNYLQRNDQLGSANLTRVDIGSGAYARFVRGCELDLFYASPSQPRNERDARLPVELKTSNKWNTDMRSSTNDTRQHDFRRVLSQVNFYMKTNHTRYACIITDSEMVAIRRLDRNGNLELSDPIPWRHQSNSQNQVRLTMLLALWYLGMLAAEEGNWRLP